MANNISYIIELKDKFSKISKKFNFNLNEINRNAKKVSTTIGGKLTRSFKRLGVALGPIGRKLKGIGTKLGAIAKSKAGMIGFAGAAIGAGVVLKKLITKGADFEESVADLAAITGLSGQALDDFSDQMLDTAKKYITSAEDVATANKLIGSGKPELLKNIPALQEVTNEVLLLKNAARGLGLEQSASIVVESLNQLGLDPDQAGRVVNVLAAGSKEGASEIAETGAAVVKSGTAAFNAGLSFEDLNAAIQLVALGGIKGAEAGTALNAIFGRLRRQGFDINTLGLAAALQEVKDGLDLIKDPTELALAESKVFGEEHGKVGLALLRLIPRFDQMKRAITGTRVAQEQADIQMDIFNKKMDLLGITIDDKLIKSFDELSPTLNEQIEAMTKWVDSFNIENVVTFTKALGGAIKAIVLIGSLAAGMIFISGTVANLIFKIFDVVTTAIGKSIEFVFSKIQKLITLFGELTGLFDFKNTLDFENNLSFPMGRKIINRGRFPPPLDLSIKKSPLASVVNENTENTTQINGEIVVRAAEGTKIESMKLKTSSGKQRGRFFRNKSPIGINMVPAFAQ